VSSPNVAAVTGVDVNEYELRQAADVFSSNEKLHWVYADVFASNLPLHHYDRIMLNGCVQYFPDIAKLITRLKALLAPGGEIHILDSPFYKTEKAGNSARKRSEAYYTALGYPEMAKGFRHHLWRGVEVFVPVTLYRPSRLSSLLRRARLGGLLKSVNPYKWIR